MALLSILKSFLESAPQLMLQAYIWTKSSGSTQVPGASITVLPLIPVSFRPPLRSSCHPTDTSTASIFSPEHQPLLAGSYSHLLILLPAISYFASCSGKRTPSPIRTLPPLFPPLTASTSFSPKTSVCDGRVRGQALCPPSLRRILPVRVCVCSHVPCHLSVLLVLPLFALFHC